MEIMWGFTAMCLVLSIMTLKTYNRIETFLGYASLTLAAYVGYRTAWLQYEAYKFIFAILMGILLACGVAMWLYIKLVEQKPSSFKPSARVLKQRVATYPSPYPNGWYALALSEEVAVGDTKSVEALGQVFAVYRAESGQVGILDAYCPHLGANLAEGGKVCGEHLQCPFHQWEFNREGKCTKVPYSKSIPSTAKTKAYPAKEYYGFICVFFDAEGREPEYEPKVFQKIHDNQMVFRGEMETMVNMHLLEFCENSADYQHFSVLHGDMMFPFTKIPLPYITVNHRTTFESHENMVIFRNNPNLSFRGTEIPRSGAQVIVTIHGPAGVVSFHFITEIGEIVLFETHTPVGALELKTRFRWYADKHIPRLLVWYVVGQWLSQIESDLQVWENKVHLRKPGLVREDGPIMQLRRYFNRFYSENSKNVGKDLLEW